jgi:periplasmic copper chaperone A
VVGDEVSVMSGFGDQAMSSGVHTAASAHLGRLGSFTGIFDALSLCNWPRKRKNGRIISEVVAAMGPCGFPSLKTTRRTSYKFLARIAAAFWSSASSCLVAAVVCLFFTGAQVRSAQGEGLDVSDAWVPAADDVGRDVPLLVAIRNKTDSPDALVRVRCPVANFAEKHTVDRGEGAPAMRSISAIPIPANSVVTLKPNEYHVMLLQTRQPLAVGERFSCALVFQKAGTIETEVEVRRSH